MKLFKFFIKVWKEIKVIRGKASKNKRYSSHRGFADNEMAVQAFERSKEKLFDVSKWSKLPSIASAGFNIYDAKGQPKVTHRIESSNFIFIDLPGPTPETWVKVIDLQEKEKEAWFTVRPCPDPREAGEEVRDVEHFFDEEATSTFKVRLRGKTIFGYEIGKEEGINNHDKKAGGREVVNTLIAIGGWAFFQEMQWKSLTDYLVHNTEIEK